jgi:wobble nucleotide-excising tRNase
VFNRDFVDQNVFPVGGGDLLPIFVLGAESVEKQKDIERLKGERSTAQSKLVSARSTKQGAERSFDQFCIDRAKLMKDTLRSSGQNQYNNYNKTDFQSDARDMAAGGDAASRRLSDAEREKLLARHWATPKPKIQEVMYTLPNFDALLASLSELVTTTVVSTAIQALKDDPTLAEWTREGLRLHHDLKPERCLFCEQALPEGRLAALEAHFSAQYEQFMQRLDHFVAELEAWLRTASELQVPNKAELYDDLAAEFQAAETGLQEAVGAAQAFLAGAVQALKNKKRRPFEQIPAEFQGPQVDAEAIEKLNAVIRKHNQASDQFQSRVEAARVRLARDMIAAEVPDFVRLGHGVEQATADVEAATQELQGLDSEIARLEREIIEHRQPAEELNDDLSKYLGHDELQLAINETGYSITRNGEPAQSLSEGEATAIALLYFLKSLRDRRFNLAQGVVVLDDPVSSLDANALYLAFGFIRERTNGAGQLIVLTHNFTFFRQVRNWFHHVKGQKSKVVSRRPARFYMLDCMHDQNERRAGIRWLDPLLEQYESEYHYLFARVYRASTEQEPASLEQNYVLPNMARRLLEAFLAFRQPQASGELWQQMQAVVFDEAKKLRILRFLHTHSHSDALGEPEHDPSVLAEGRAVLKDLLEMIKSLDAAHFSAMEQLVGPAADTGEDGGEAVTA